MGGGGDGMSDTTIWTGITLGFVCAMLWAWCVCRPTREERDDMLRHLQHLDAIRGRK